MSKNDCVLNVFNYAKVHYKLKLMPEVTMDWLNGMLNNCFVKFRLEYRRAILSVITNCTG